MFSLSVLHGTLSSENPELCKCQMAIYEVNSVHALFFLNLHLASQSHLGIGFEDGKDSVKKITRE